MNAEPAPGKPPIRIFNSQTDVYMKLFSYLQRTHGVSRREYAEMIKQKAVYCNDVVVESFQADIAPGTKLEVRSRGKVVLSEEVKEPQRRKTIIVLFNKPKGYTVAKEDKHNKTIYELLPKSRHKDFYYIGRLDKDSHGLLLLTNSPALVDFYEKPENNIYKTYEVQIDKPLKSNHVQKAKKGVYADESGMPVKDDLKGEKNTQVGVELLKAVNMIYKPFKDKHFVIIQLNEWKKRHIRRLLKAMGYAVKDLKRTKVGKYQLGSIKPGKYMMQEYK